MSKKLIINIIIKILEDEYPNAHCVLKYKNNFELLVAARLSARCKDERVNKVTPVLFKEFSNVYDIANASISKVEDIVRPCGMFKIKAKNIINFSKQIIKNFNSKVPNIFLDLISLDGIGRKTANLILSEAFGIQTIVVDTHVSRVTFKLGLHCYKNPVKIERVLKNLIPQNYWSKFCHKIIWHGRMVCVSRNPKCDICKLNNFCLLKE